MLTGVLGGEEQYAKVGQSLAILAILCALNVNTYMHNGSGIAKGTWV